MSFAPMLSGVAPKDLSKLRYPVAVSPKLDGIRALIVRGVVLSRNLKPIPNKFVQQLYGNRPALEGYDGELVVGDATAPECFRRTSSVVMSHDKDVVGLQFCAFDCTDNAANLSWRERFNQLNNLERGISVVPHSYAHSPEGVAASEEAALELGYEGVMLRDPSGPYKFGRSTEKEGWLLKLKRFEDAEAVVIGVEEQMHNGNELTQDALGHAKRSTHKARKTGKNTLGALRVRGLNGAYKGVEFNVGTGFSDALRAEYWLVRESLPGNIVKFRYFPTGSKDAPRFPVFVGLRDRRDM